MNANHSEEKFVQFINIQKTYNGVNLVVRDFNLDVKSGEFITMLGPSGSGKTTCLMMLAGFETPTYGQIILAGKEINKIPPHKRNIGMVFQNYALFPNMSVGENLAFPLEVRKANKSEIEEKVKNALQMVRLDNFANRRIAQLSGGQQQRVAVARALVFEPELVLMDEPLGALDKNLREEMQYEIKHIHENLGVSVMYVTHDQTEALTMSDRIVVFNEGIVQQLDSPEKLYEKPTNVFVANFIGDNNLLNGRILQTNAQNCLIDLGEGVQMQAVNSNQRKVGDEVVVSLRPERVIIGPSSENCQNITQAVIKELIYHGDYMRCICKVAGSDSFIIKTPNISTFSNLQEGEQIYLGWLTEDAHALNPTVESASEFVS